MPRVDYVRYKVTRADSDNAENWESENGTTLSEVLSDELGVNPDKFSIYVNGVKVDDLKRTVENGDSINLQPKNYSSGC